MTGPRAGTPPLLLLAGTSEAGKSTAGQHLARCGGRRLKIRNILLALHSGTEVRHEGVATREGFDYEEFITQLSVWVAAASQPLIIVESFIDTELALLVRSRWPTICEIVFIDADAGLRIARHASVNGLTTAESERIVRGKDHRKKVFEQFARWQQIADYWLENNGSIAHFKYSLEQIMTSTLARPGTRSAT